MALPCDDLYVSPDPNPRPGEVALARQFSRRLAQAGPVSGTVTFNADGSIADGATGVVITFPSDGSIVTTTPTGNVYTTTFSANTITTT